MNIGPNENLLSILKPNGAVIILDEFTFHPKNFNLVQLRHVVADLVCLLKAIFFFVPFYQIFLQAQRSKIVIYLIVRLGFIYGCIKADDDGRSAADL